MKRGSLNKIMQSKFVKICKTKVGLHFYEIQSRDFTRPGLYIYPVGGGERAKIYIASEKVKDMQEEEGTQERFFCQFDEDTL